jgi:hypothetical protein
MSDFISALHFEQCIAIMPESCDPEDEQPHDVIRPRASTHIVAVLTGFSFQ